MRLSVLRFTTFAALVGTAVCSVPAAAQSGSRIRSGIAAGAAPGQGRTGPGFALLGSADLERPGARLAARGELLFTQSRTDMHGYVGVPCYACSALVPYSSAAMTEQSLGATFGATYRLSPATGRARGYLLGGVGVYRVQTVFTGTAGSPCPPGAACLATLIAPYEARETEQDVGAGAHVGLGGALRTGSVELTAEARLHFVDTGVGSRRVVPLTLGVRF